MRAVIADDEPTERNHRPPTPSSDFWFDDLSLEVATAPNPWITGPIPAELLALPTLVPLDSYEPRRRTPPRRRAGWAAAIAAVLGMGSTGLSVALAMGVVAGLLVTLRPGGPEQWLGDALTVVRRERPELIVPIEDLEILVQRAAYASSLALAGAPPEEPRFVLPDELIAGPPDIPRAGPHQVPEVSFDPAILSSPLEFAHVAGWPRWMTVARPILNPAFPRDAALVLRFDLRYADLHWMPGRTDPWPTVNHERLADAVPAPDRSGRVPSGWQKKPFIVFGGGFQTIHFPSFGARWQGHDVIPMRDGMQTVAIYGDGHLEMGPWETLSHDGILDARQNLPPLVRQGKIPANIAFLNVGTLSTQRLDAGGIRTYSDVHTWRSALGLQENGDLVYVLAARSTPQQLAATLLRAGAVEGMQLDINAASYAAPTLGTPGATDTVTTPLFTGLWDSGRRFVTGADRDFFVVTARVRP